MNVTEPGQVIGNCPYAWVWRCGPETRPTLSRGTMSWRCWHCMMASSTCNIDQRSSIYESLSIFPILSYKIYTYCLQLNYIVQRSLYFQKRISWKERCSEECVCHNLEIWLSNLAHVIMNLIAAVVTVLKERSRSPFSVWRSCFDFLFCILLINLSQTA